MTKKMIFRMSEAGECPRALVAEKLNMEGTPVPSWLEAAAREGKRHEIWMKEDLRAEGYEIEECKLCPICKERYGTEREGIHVEYDATSFMLIGHTDGRFSKNGEKGGLELKSMSQYEFDRWMKDRWYGFSGYAAQITVYMIADPQAKWLYIAKNRSSGYKDRRELTEFPGEPDAIFNNLEVVVHHIGEKTLPEVEYISTSIQCQRCRFKKLCIPEIKALSPIEENDLLDATAMWREGNALKSKGKELIARAAEKFEFHSQAVELDRWRFDELAISYIHVKASESYSKENLLRVFTAEQLKPAMQVKSAYDYIKVKDLRREEQEEGDAEMSE